ncbi:hypothetical protein E4U21_006655 [Claviceps maximensis]|nr:hypothetical protein E4U21_006655 [Claviceps maximensis]
MSPRLRPVDTTKRRLLSAAPILLWSLIVIPSLIHVSNLAPLVQQWRTSSVYSRHGVVVPLTSTFYGVEWLDRIFADIVATSGLFHFHEQSLHYWHSLDFLAQFGAVYGILMLEASREGHRFYFLLGTVAALTLAQVASGAILPIYFFFSHISTDPLCLRSRSGSGSGTRAMRETPGSSALAILPTVLLAFYVPHFSSYLSSDLTARHWWNWLWQPFPVWGAVLYFALVGALALVPTLSRSLLLPSYLAKRVKLHMRLTATRLTAICIGLINIGTYWYVVVATGSSWSWWRLCVPNQVLVSTPMEHPDAVVGTFLQFDYVTVFGSALSWLGLQFADLKDARLMSMSWTCIVVLGLVCGVLLGPGALCWIGWMAREELLASAERSARSKSACEKEA